MRGACLIPPESILLSSTFKTSADHTAEVCPFATIAPVTISETSQTWLVRLAIHGLQFVLQASGPSIDPTTSRKETLPPHSGSFENPYR
jgi:hypothetical protein